MQIWLMSLMAVNDILSFISFMCVHRRQDATLRAGHGSQIPERRTFDETGSGVLCLRSRNRSLLERNVTAVSRINVR